MRKMNTFLKKAPWLLTLILSTYLGGLIVAPEVKGDAYGFMAQILSKGESSGRAYVGDDKPVGIVVKYVGDDAASGAVAVDASTGDLTFTTGASGSETTDTSFECPVSGDLGGIIDVSHADCNTLGEVVDTINGSCTGCDATEWRAVILDGVRSDTSIDALVTIAATAATPANGLNLVVDTTVALVDTVALGLCRTLGCMLTTRGAVAGTPTIIENPYEGLKQIPWEVSFTSTYSSGTSIITIIDCDIKQKVGAAGSETCTTVYSLTGGDTTVAKTLNFTTFGFPPRKDQKRLVRLTNSVAMDTVSTSVVATQYPYR